MQDLPAFKRCCIMLYMKNVLELLGFKVKFHMVIEIWSQDREACFALVMFADVSVQRP